MDFNVALLLVVVTAVTGVIWLVDTLLFARKRRAAAAAESAEVRDPALVEYARSFFPVLLVVLVLRSFIVEPFRIPSQSMMPTLLVGDFILVNKFSYGIRLPVIHWKVVPLGSPERGDVMVCRYPRDPKWNFIKRVVGLPGDEIARRRRSGEEVTDQVEAPIVAFTGDTTIDVVDREAVVREARLLIMEVTVIDDRVSVERARKTGHVHLFEIAERAELFQNQAILFTHFSARYGAREIVAALDRHLPPGLRERVTPLLDGHGGGADR